MARQVIIGFTTEGKTDIRFFESVIQRTFEDVAFECTGQIEVLPVQHIENLTGPFTEMVIQCARQAEGVGVMVLCVHTDADAPNDKKAFSEKIHPAFLAVENLGEEPVCKNLVAIVPVQMTEAWMLSDKALLKKEIGTDKSVAELGIEKRPEAYTDPKQVIDDAIRIARLHLSKRRRHKLTIAELYLPMGQKVSLNKLERLGSYKNSIMIKKFTSTTKNIGAHLLRRDIFWWLRVFLQVVRLS